MDAINESLDEAIRPYVPKGDRNLPATSLRRLLNSGDSPANGSAPSDASTLAAPTGTPDATETLLATRQDTHGDFYDNARVAQALKRIFRAEPGWELLADVERESLDMIALKFARILSGKSLELQHWEDVVGYAKLAEKLCKPAA